ncbi:unnamed protein product [Gulo gulo]|uniref:Uncharacterized protein n=1 Tax=Gulo gulo TaxID=48420 RepID=A0A9X9M0G0_GULGU|nr:unnamed protein product [Gulo gulo]
MPGSSRGPHRNEENAESWKTQHRGQTHRSQPQAREKFHLTLLQTRLQVTGCHSPPISSALLRTPPDYRPVVLGPHLAQMTCLQKAIQVGQQDILKIPVNPPPRK